MPKIFLVIGHHFFGLVDPAPRIHGLEFLFFLSFGLHTSRFLFFNSLLPQDIGLVFLLVQQHGGCSFVVFPFCGCLCRQVRVIIQKFLYFRIQLRNVQPGSALAMGDGDAIGLYFLNDNIRIIVSGNFPDPVGPLRKRIRGDKSLQRVCACLSAGRI